MPQRLPRSAPHAKRYLVTYAQNATPVDKRALAVMLVYCKHNDAQLLVLPGRYKNPTSRWAEEAQDHDWWAQEVMPYLFAGRRKIGSHLTIYGDVSIQPTAARPLTGFEVFAGQASALFGHPKIQLMTIPSGRRRYPRVLSTTGAITVPNYVPGKAGKKAEPHHKIGAMVIERDGRNFHMRHIECAADGSFTDLDKHYTAKKVIDALPARLVVLGDIHEDMSDLDVLQATLQGPDSLIGSLKPTEVYIHDLLHFGRRSHHSRDRFDHKYDTRMGGTDLKESVHEEVLNSIRFLDYAIPAGCAPVVVRSNHDEALDRWLREARTQDDPINAEFYHETWLRVLRRRRELKKWVPAFQVVYEEQSFLRRATFLDRDEPRKVNDVYLNFHGDKGPNGSRGSAMAYSKLGIKTIIGHYHRPQIQDGCYVVGVTGRLDQGYNFTPSAWLHAHCVMYATGARALILVIDGKFRA